MTNNIQYVLHHQVNKAKWDACINDAENGLLYACSKYLDCMAVYWDALVLNDYQMVMPLPIRKKYGISYLFQPSITPVLGVFGNSVSPDIITAFLNVIPKKYKVWDLSFNNSNTLHFNKGVCINRNNYILDLHKDYVALSNNYSENIRRNITRAIKNECVLKKEVSFTDVAAICKTEFPKFTKVENGLFEKLNNVYESFKSNSASYGVYTKEGTLLASAIFLFYKKRAYYWLVGNIPQSKQYGASSLLIDNFIKDYASSDLTIDFEGSDIKTIADFYKKFGAGPEAYTTLFVNNLPFPFKLLKPMPHHYRSLISE